jgi:hypothetical protein
MSCGIGKETPPYSSGNLQARKQVMNRVSSLSGSRSNADSGRMWRLPDAERAGRVE